jgi:hypothetical protein
MADNDGCTLDRILGILLGLALGVTAVVIVGSLLAGDKEGGGPDLLGEVGGRILPGTTP